MGGQIFQCMEPVTVNNYLHEDEPSYLSWLSTALSLADESAHVYNNDLELIYHNNRYGTLSDAPLRALANIHTVFNYLRKFYSNTDCAVDNIVETLNNVSSRTFDLVMINTPDTVLLCRSSPVLDGKKVLGVVVLASRRFCGTAVRCGKSRCSQPQPCCGYGKL